MLRVVGESAQDEGDGCSLLDEIAREGTRRMLVAALETEVAAYLKAHREERNVADNPAASSSSNAASASRKSPVERPRG